MRSHIQTCSILILVCSTGLAWSYLDDPTEKYTELSNDFLPEFCSEGSGCRKRILAFTSTLSATLYAAAEALVKKTFMNLHGTQYFCKSKVSYIAEANAVDGYFFCRDYVDYAAACDAQDETSCNNTWTIEMHKKFQNTLGVYRCGAYSSIWTCTNCSDAYKRWLCAASWRKHVVPGTEATEEGRVRHPLLPPSTIFTVTNHILTQT
jgi:hypothetical protein